MERLKPLLAGLALAGVLLGAAGSAGGSGPPATARAGASRLLEKRSVPATGRVVKSRTILGKGKRYRLVITGTVSIVVGSQNGTIGSRFDALYCYENFGTSPLASDPSSSCTTHIRRHGSFLLGLRGLGFPDQLNPRGIDTAYNARHRYAVSFRAKRTGKLSFVFRTNVRERSGHYAVRLYGAGAAPKKSPPAHRCPAPRARGASPARVAAACHSVVSFRFSQSGPPSGSHPAPGPGFVTTETHGVGKVFFNARPKLGRTSAGSPAGVVIHTDTYQSPINPFLFEDGEITLKLVNAKLTRRPDGDDSLVMGVEVRSVTGVVYSRDYDGKTVHKNDGGQIALTVDPPRHRKDRLTFVAQCGACSRSGPLQDGDHAHEYRAGGSGVLQIEIDDPHPL